MSPEVKDHLRQLGLTRVYRAVRAVCDRVQGWRVRAPVMLTTWIFQRVIGINCHCPWPVHFTSQVARPERIKIHPSVALYFAVSGGCYIQAANGIEMGEGTIFAPGVKIISANHTLRNLNTWDEGPPIRIGKHCWIGANAVILPGVQLGNHVTVGAGSVVTKSFPDNSVIAGVPARILRTLENAVSIRDEG